MKNKNLMISCCLFLLIVISLVSTCVYKNKTPTSTSKLEAMVVSSTSTTLTIQDKNNILYTIPIDNLNIDNGSKIIIEYTGLLNQNNEMQDISIQNYNVMSLSSDSVPDVWDDKGIFSDYYKLAKEKLDELTLDEKIGQLLLVRYPSSNQVNILKENNLSGFVFFEKDFQNKNTADVQTMIKNLQDNAKIPLLTAVDEEGGSVVRISSNPLLVFEPFKSPKALYDLGGFEEITKDTIKKSDILSNLGLNVNLAPVVDVSTSPSDYIYNRSLGENTELTSKYAETVIKASKNTPVSYTLKHFPGYGNNIDSHTVLVSDTRELADIKTNDLPPFKAGIDAGAEAVLVNHNVIMNIDANNPASLSPAVHNLLRSELGFTGIIMTDNLDMGSLNDVDNINVKALLAGNDLIITTDYQTAIEEIKQGITDKQITEDTINKAAFRVLAWKYYKGIMYVNEK